MTNMYVPSSCFSQINYHCIFFINKQREKLIESHQNDKFKLGNTKADYVIT